jgi:hypothetical protein
MHHIHLRSALPAPPAYISYVYIYIYDMYDLLTYMYTYTFEQRTASPPCVHITSYTYMIYKCICIHMCLSSALLTEYASYTFKPFKRRTGSCHCVDHAALIPCHRVCPACQKGVSLLTCIAPVFARRAHARARARTLILLWTSTSYQRTSRLILLRHTVVINHLPAHARTHTLTTQAA